MGWGKVRKKTKIVKIKGCGDAFWILEGFYGGGVTLLAYKLRIGDREI